MLADDFRMAVDIQRQERVHPSELLCVDESISRWYGVGGTWLDVRLPFYVKISRKPEFGSEIKNITYRKGGFMVGIEFAKSEASRVLESESTIRNHGTRVLMKLAEPWSGSGRHVCADSYFASVDRATILYRNGLRFSGVVKTATEQFR